MPDLLGDKPLENSFRSPSYYPMPFNHFLYPYMPYSYYFVYVFVYLLFLYRSLIERLSKPRPTPWRKQPASTTGSSGGVQPAAIPTQAFGNPLYTSGRHPGNAAVAVLPSGIVLRPGKHLATVASAMAQGAVSPPHSQLKSAQDAMAEMAALLPMGGGGDGGAKSPTSFGVAGAAEMQITQLRNQVRDLELDLQEASLKTAEAEHNYANERARSASQQEEQKHNFEDDLQAVRATVDARDLTITEGKRNEQSLQNIRQELERRIDTLESYISELPTTQEFASKVDELAASENMVVGFKEQIKAAEKEVVALTEALVDRDEGGRRLNLELKRLSQQLVDHKESAEHGREELLRTNTLLADESRRRNLMLDTAETELEETKKQCSTWKQRLEDERTVQAEADERFQRRENQLILLRASVAEYQASLRDREFTISELDDFKESAEKKMAAQAATIQDLRGALDTMRSVNQELLASNYNRDQPRSQAVVAAGFALDAHAPAEHQAAERLTAETDAIQDELASCVMDLRSVIQVALQRAGGKKPNIGQLLGVESGQGELFVRTIDRHNMLETIKSMHSEVEQMRSLLSDRYAEDVGADACGVQ